ncbi:MAG: hypothetical protein LBO00_06595 [Zoogloeaceae bacterium]|nr:hypothetical protein [Zoogloeaceae bacterium]
MKKKTVRPLVALAALFLAALAAMAIYILTDAPLSPQAEKMLRHQPPPVLPARNAFVGIAGLNAPADGDFIRAGEEDIRRAHQDAPGLSPRQETPQKTQDLKASAKYAYACDKEMTEGCLAEIRADAPNIRRLLAENETLIARYLAIQAMPEFSNAVVASMAFSLPYNDLMTLSKLLSARAILDIQAGNVRQGLAFIEQDMAFYRRTLAAPEIGLVDMMVAVAQIRRQAILLALLAQEAQLRGETERIKGLLAPLDSPRETFLNALWREQVFVGQGLYHLADTVRLRDAQSDGVLDFVALFLLRKNMTLNLASEIGETERTLIHDTPLAQLRDMQENWWKKEIRPRVCAVSEDDFYCRHWKNRTGEILATIAPPAHVTYLFKVHDADAHIRLLRAQLEFRQAAAQESSQDKESPEKILARLGPETFNPYTGQPFAWNPERKTIGFMSAAAKDQKWREVRLDFPAP